MAANGSSVNTANIINALGNVFKDPSGAALPNEQLATVLIRYVNQLNDFDKQGKLNQQQIMPGVPMIPSHIQSCSYLLTGRIKFCTTSYGIMQTSTNPRRRQSRCMEGAGAKHPIHITYILSTWHGVVVTVALSLCLYRLHLRLSPRRPLSAEDDDRKLDSHGHIPYQRDS